MNSEIEFQKWLKDAMDETVDIGNGLKLPNHQKNPPNGYPLSLLKALWDHLYPYKDELLDIKHAYNRFTAFENVELKEVNELLLNGLKDALSQDGLMYGMSEPSASVFRQRRVFSILKECLDEYEEEKAGHGTSFSAVKSLKTKISANGYQRNGAVSEKND